MNLLKSIISSVTAFAVISMVPASALAAGSASFSLSSSRATVAQNETFSVAIYENGTSVNAVTAKLAFDAAKVQFVGIDAGGSAFPNGIAETNGVTRYTNGGEVVNGSAYVAAATFKALTTTGTATVSVTTGSKIASAGVDTWNGAASATSVTLTAPAAAATPATPGRGAGTAAQTTPSAAAAKTPTTTGTTKTAPTTAATVTTPAATTENTDTKTPEATKSDNKTAATTASSSAKKGHSALRWVLPLAVLAAVAAGVYVIRKRTVEGAAVVAATSAKPVTKSAGVKSNVAVKKTNLK